MPNRDHLDQRPIQDDVAIVMHEHTSETDETNVNHTSVVRHFYRSILETTGAVTDRPVPTYNVGIHGQRNAASASVQNTAVRPRPSGRRSLSGMLELLVGDLQLNGYLLEVGCGLGSNLSALKSPDQYRCGIDLLHENVVVAKGRSAADGLTADAHFLPIRSNTFDTVLNVESGGHYTNIDDFFREVGRVLKVGGHLLYADGILANCLEEYRTLITSLGFSELMWTDVSAQVVDAFDRQWISSAAAKRLTQRVLNNPDVAAAMARPMIENAWLKYRLDAGLVKYVVARFRLDTRPGSAEVARLPQRVRDLQPLLDISEATFRWADITNRNRQNH